MYKVCKTKQSINRQKEIEQTFLDLLSTVRYEEISVKSICEKAKIPRKAFYRYFECKEGVLFALIQHILVGYNEHYEKNKPVKRTIKNELACYFSFWITGNRSQLLRALIKNDLIAHFLRISREIPENNIIDISRFFPDKTQWEKRQILNFAISGLTSIMIEWFYGGCKESTLEMAGLACNLIGKPLFPNLTELGILME